MGAVTASTGVVVLIDDPDGRSYCRSIVEQEPPGDHASLPR
jgi:hypothetical protein